MKNLLRTIPGRLGIISAVFLLLGPGSGVFAQQPPEASFGADKAAAEKFYMEGSYAKAHAAYERLRGLSALSQDDARWVAFRCADTQWRAAAGSDNPDPTQSEAGRSDLERQIRDLTRAEQHDFIWAAVEESLGDFLWARRNSYADWGQAWPHYEAALDWWAGQSDLDRARDHYLNIIWHMTDAPRRQGMFFYWGIQMPLGIFENAAKIAQTPEDQAHAHYLIASALRTNPGTWPQRARIPEEFEAAIQAGKKTAWRDDALFNYAQWMEQAGRTHLNTNGNWTFLPDYPKALALYRQFVSEFTNGESRYWEQAQAQIKNITVPQLQVSVGPVFLPGSEIQYELIWRNVREIKLTLYAVDLNEQVRLPADTDSRTDWLSAIDLAHGTQLKTWSRETNDNGNHEPGQETVRLDPALAPGAYVLEARSGNQSSRDLILVTDAALVLKTSGKHVLACACNALNSAPLAGASVRLWEGWWSNPDQWHWRSQSKTADSNGLAVFDLDRAADNNLQLFASVQSSDRQAICLVNSYWYPRNSPAEWRIHAFTDRPAYRPKETVNFKFIARRYEGSVYSTPANQTIEYELTDPRGAKVKADKIKLNEFGSAWGTLDLTEQMPLGEYSVRFWDAGRHNEIGGAELFRLEEYKLPEFQVTVRTPEENGQKKAFRLGETVAAAIQADYYFGGPVANADVAVLVRQKPYWHYWHEPRPFPWFYDDMDAASPDNRWRWYGGGQIITNATLKTDATGKATLSFDTPQGASQDFEYDIEARVTDASRREIAGHGSVRVTQQRYYVYASAAQTLYQPQDKVAVTFKALDANDQPVHAEGTATISRDYWCEIWLAPDGREVKGEDLKRLQAAATAWPPPPARPDQKEWQLRFRGYEHDEILSRSLKTDTNGEAEISFAPGREGYYRVAWSGLDAETNRLPQPIKAETAVWVSSHRTSELGYRSDGVQIIADKDTFHMGGIAPVMLVAPAADRYVLFTVEGEDLYHYELVHLDGTVKLVNLPVDEKYVPNIFLGATLVCDRRVSTDMKQIVVPPAKNFLTVQVKPDREQYEPRDEGTLTICTRDAEGRGVSAEVALSLVDESIFYIQSDYAGDPRQFFFGTKREQRIQTQSSMNQKPYAKLVEAEGRRLIDDLEKKRLEESRREPSGRSKDRELEWEIQSAGIRGGGGGAGGGSINGVPAVGYEGDRMMVNGINAFAASSAVAVEAPPPMSPAPMMMQHMAEASMAAEPPSLSGAAAPNPEPAVVVRNDFRSTVFWQPDVMTGTNGQATVTVKYPDSVTAWKATARAVTTGNQFGLAETNTRTRQPLIVRLEAPRFFVVGDTATLSAVVNNNTAKEMSVRPNLEVGGVLAGTRLAPAATLMVPPNGEARADWVLNVSAPGEVRLKVTGRGEKYADAMERTLTAYEHGIEKFVSKSGKTRDNQTAVELVLPHERRRESASLTVRVSPSLAVTMLDALPYLIDYPYGCTEQTLSRFLPTVVTMKTLRDLGLRPEDAMERVFGGVESNTAAATHPQGKRNLEDADKMTRASLDRLYDFQHSDGGWGWWKQGESDHWMTAYVVWGLALAKDAGVEVKAGVLRRAVKYLNERLVEEKDDYDLQSFMLFGLAQEGHSRKGAKLTKFEQAAFDNLWRNRDQLNAYTRALLALSAHGFGFTDQARTLIDNLENGVIRDERPDQSILVGGQTANTNSGAATLMGTAHWGNDGVFWHWSDSGVEATAFALRALLAIEPTNQLVEASANWLIKNRRGAQWNNTRDTAMTVLALNDYLRTGGELNAAVSFKVLVNGALVAERKISAADRLAAPGTFTVDPKLIQDTNKIEIVAAGSDGPAGPLYFSAAANYFSTEEPIAPAGSEIFVKREYYKLTGRPTLLKGYVYDRQPLPDGGTVETGERVEAVLTIEAKNNYEYLLFEDLKPAGFEAVEIRSGDNVFARQLRADAAQRKFGAGGVHEIKAGETLSEIAKAHGVSVAELMKLNTNTDPKRLQIGARLVLPAAAGGDEGNYTGAERWVYQELRDRQTAEFVDRLPQGLWEIRYDFRAETPGRFHALPVVGRAMYVPEIRCNSAEARVAVVEKAP